MYLKGKISVFPQNFSQIQGAWVAQSVKRLTSAQVMILMACGFEPTSGSVLTAQSLEPALDSCLPLSLPLSQLCSVSLSLKNKHCIKIKDKNRKH